MPIAHHSRVPAAFAGSRGNAVVAVTVHTDFDVRHYDVSFATMWFATATNTDTFIPVIKTVLDLGDAQSAVAQTTVGAIIFEIGFGHCQ